jgi:hypothetical protein
MNLSGGMMEPECPGTIPPPREMPKDLLARERPRESDRPAVVTAVAAYEWIKAGFLGLQFWILWSAVPASTVPVSNMQSGTGHDPFLVFIPMTAIFLAVLGFGLWNLQKWALYAVLPIGFMSGGYVVGHAYSLNWIKEYIPRSVVVATLIIDVAAIVVLARREVFMAFSADDDDTQMLSM